MFELFLSTRDAIPTTSPPFSSITFIVSSDDFPVVTTSSAIITFCPSLTSNPLLRVITPSTLSVNIAGTPSCLPIS